VVQEHNPEVVVLDISMPRLNGLDAARQLHKLLPTWSSPGFVDRLVKSF
jgi:CheY-like chemotaxis protein